MSKVEWNKRRKLCIYDDESNWICVECWYMNQQWDEGLIHNIQHTMQGVCVQCLCSTCLCVLCIWTCGYYVGLAIQANSGQNSMYTLIYSPSVDFMSTESILIKIVRSLFISIEIRFFLHFQLNHCKYICRYIYIVDWFIRFGCSWAFYPSHVFHCQSVSSGHWLFNILQ